MKLGDVLEWYQHHISLYEKQSWEKTVEQRILRGLSYKPRKSAKIKSDFIDVDLVRGSTFPKAKPSASLWLAGFYGVLRMLFLPLFSRWWWKETPRFGFAVLLIIYSSVISCCILTVYQYNQGALLEIVSVCEVVTPLVLLLVLSIIHSQIVCIKHGGDSLLSDWRSKCYSEKHNLKALNRVSIFTRDKNSFSCNYKNTQKPFGRSSSHLNKFSKFGSSTTDGLFTTNTRCSSESNISLSHWKDVADANHINASQTYHSLRPGRPVSLQNLSNSSLPTSSFYEQTSGEEEPKLCHKEFTKSSQFTFPKNDYSNSSQNTDSLLHVPKFRRISDEMDYDNLSEAVSDITGDTGGSGGDCDTPADVLHPQARNNTHTCFCNCKQRVPSVRLRHPSPSSDLGNPSCNSSGESEVDELCSNIPSFSPSKFTEDSLFSMKTQCDDLSCSSESETGWDDLQDQDQSPLPSSKNIDWHIQGAPAAIITSSSTSADKVSCKVWDGSEMSKVDLSVLDISSAVISNVEDCSHTNHYFIFGILVSITISLIPSLYKINWASTEDIINNIWEFVFSPNIANNVIQSILYLIDCAFKYDLWIMVLVSLTAFNRLILATFFFFLLCVAERTFKQRLFYAKHFSYLTSARRARKYGLPHFRLKKVVNIKTWLSVRSCLKKCGPQHTVDVIVNMSFILSLILVSYLCVELLKDDDHQYTIYNCELYIWCFAISIFLIRFMTLGASINKKYSNLSVLIMEQINLYLHMEQKPQKKDHLMLANNVLKLVSVLLKELDSPFKISGLSANPLLYNVTKLVVLSACSGVLSDILGFKLKLHKLKLI